MIQETFKDKLIFKHSGLSVDESDCNKKTRIQLDSFYQSLLLYGAKGISTPKDWFEAFLYLERLLMEKDTGEKQAIFIDELPWLDTPSSNFLSAFEGFWNSFACCRDNLTVIVCGSATSWMENKLINNHGGLYGRVTYEINLNPFTLKECKEFFEARNVRFSDYDIAQAYMAVGGIPYYLNYFECGKSLAQNINDMFFKKNSVLKFEYGRLFDSMFDNVSLTKKTVELLYSKKIGFSREEIVRKLGIADNGNLSKVLNALIASSFVAKYVPFGLAKKTNYYKLIDPFCLFFLTFVEKGEADEDYWISNYLKQTATTWRGIAFENVCFNHVPQIKAKLGISGVGAQTSSWYYDNGSQKGQVDLLIKRNDNILNICEIKFCGGDFLADKEDFKKAANRCQEAYKHLPKRFGIHSTLITTYGLTKNEYSSAYQNVITLEDLFRC